MPASLTTTEDLLERRRALQLVYADRRLDQANALARYREARADPTTPRKELIDLAYAAFDARRAARKDDRELDDCIAAIAAIEEEGTHAAA